MEKSEVKKGKRMIKLELLTSQLDVVEGTRPAISQNSMATARIGPSLNFSAMDYKPSSLQDDLLFPPTVQHQEVARPIIVCAWICEADSLGQGNYFLHFMSEDEIGQYEMANRFEYNMEKVFRKAHERKSIRQASISEQQRKVVHKSIMALTGRQNAFVQALMSMNNDERIQKETDSVIARKGKMTLITRSEMPRQQQAQVQIICCCAIFITYAVDFVALMEKSNALFSQSPLSQLFGGRVVLSQLTSLAVRIRTANTTKLVPLINFYKKAVS